MCPGWLRHTAIKIELVETGRKKHFPLVFQLFPDFFFLAPQSTYIYFPFTAFERWEFLPFPFQKQTPNFLKAPKCSRSIKKAIWKTPETTFSPANLDQLHAQNAAVQKKSPFFKGTKKKKRRFQPALSAKRAGLEARAANPAGITTSQFGVKFSFTSDSEMPSRSATLLPWGLHKPICYFYNFFFFSSPFS